MDGRRYDSMDGGGRIAPGAAIENNAGAVVESRVWNGDRAVAEIVYALRAQLFLILDNIAL